MSALKGLFGTGGEGSGGVLSSTPGGIAARVAADTITTPNTSRSGDITRGDVSIGGLTVGGGMDTAQLALIVGAALAVAWFAWGR